MHIAGVPPFQSFCQGHAPAYLTQFNEATVPLASRAVGGGVTFAATAAVQEKFFDVSNHGAVNFNSRYSLLFIHQESWVVYLEFHFTHDPRSIALRDSMGMDKLDEFFR